MSKSNYIIQTDAIKNHVIPKFDYIKSNEWIVYANEADLLNVALFNCTAKDWRESNLELSKNSNIRDYASINELTVLSNLETHNAEMIKQGLDKEARFKVLKDIAIYQLKVLNDAHRLIGDQNLLP